MIIFRGIDKLRIVDLFKQLVMELLAPGVGQKDQSLLFNHIDWMRRQSGIMNVTCRLETVAEGNKTRITIEASFVTKEKLS